MNTAPGVEWMQMFTGALHPLEAFDDYEQLQDYYISELHKKNPASKSYTK
jgi:hypothetical protein